MSDLTEECRWGGPSTAACWNVGACGCLPTVVEEVWREAHAWQMQHLINQTFDDIARALHVPDAVEWLNRRLTRPGAP